MTEKAIHGVAGSSKYKRASTNLVTELTFKEGPTNKQFSYRKQITYLKIISTHVRKRIYTLLFGCTFALFLSSGNDLLVKVFSRNRLIILPH